MDHDFLSGVYFRHYAFLVRRYRDRSPSAIFHYATYGVSALLSTWLLAAVAVGFWLASRALGRPVAPWNAPDWLVMLGSLAVVFLPGLYVDRRFHSLQRLDGSVIELFSSPRERWRWWLAALSIAPAVGIVAACFAAIRSSS